MLNAVVGRSAQFYATGAMSRQGMWVQFRCPQALVPRLPTNHVSDQWQRASTLRKELSSQFGCPTGLLTSLCERSPSQEGKLSRRIIRPAKYVRALRPPLFQCQESRCAKNLRPSEEARKEVSAVLRITGHDYVTNAALLSTVRVFNEPRFPRETYLSVRRKYNGLSKTGFEDCPQEDAWAKVRFGSQGVQRLPTDIIRQRSRL